MSYTISLFFLWVQGSKNSKKTLMTHGSSQMTPATAGAMRKFGNCTSQHVTLQQQLQQNQPRLGYHFFPFINHFPKSRAELQASSMWRILIPCLLRLGTLGSVKCWWNLYRNNINVAYQLMNYISTIVSKNQLGLSRVNCGYNSITLVIYT